MTVGAESIARGGFLLGGGAELALAAEFPYFFKNLQVNFRS